MQKGVNCTARDRRGFPPTIQYPTTDGTLFSYPWSCEPCRPWHPRMPGKCLGKPNSSTLWAQPPGASLPETCTCKSSLSSSTQLLSCSTSIMLFTLMTRSAALCNKGMYRENERWRMSGSHHTYDRRGNLIQVIHHGMFLAQVEKKFRFLTALVPSCHSSTYMDSV